jgi:hypothetical protein
MRERNSFRILVTNMLENCHFMDNKKNEGNDIKIDLRIRDGWKWLKIVPNGSLWHYSS